MTTKVLSSRPRIKCGETNECTMEECLKAWLKETDDVQKKGGSTVHSLIAALRKMEEKAAAKGIDIECKVMTMHKIMHSLQNRNFAASAEN